MTRLKTETYKHMPPAAAICLAGPAPAQAGQPAAGGAIDGLIKAADPSLYRGYWTHWAFVKDADAGSPQPS